MSTLVDSNVLIDIFQPGSSWFAWSGNRLSAAGGEGPLIINTLVAAEVASAFSTGERFEARLAPHLFVREEVPWSAVHGAGRAYGEYRRRGGARGRVLPDFLIGAHAMAKGHRILTRDARRYRSYFPELDVIAPDSHP